MKLALLAGLLLLLAQAPASRPQPQPQPQRIASVSLSTDEILAELVPVERMVAVDTFVDDPGLSNVAGRYPQSIPRVRAELERILSLSPDLVCVSAYNSADFLEVLRRSRVAVFRFENATTFAGIRASILGLGSAVGAEEKARGLVAEMDRRLAALDAALAGVKSRPRVLYWAAGWTAGKNATIGELIERAGAINAGAELGREGMFEMGAEKLLALDPDRLLLDARDSLSELPGRELPPQLRALRGAKEGAVLRLPGRSIGALSHHVVEGAELLARALHPDRFPPAASRPR